MSEGYYKVKYDKFQDEGSFDIAWFQDGFFRCARWSTHLPEDSVTVLGDRFL